MINLDDVMALPGEAIPVVCQPGGTVEIDLDGGRRSVECAGEPVWAIARDAGDGVVYIAYRVDQDDLATVNVVTLQVRANLAQVDTSEPMPTETADAVIILLAGASNLFTD